MDSSSRTVSIDGAEGKTVGEVMISRPKTLTTTLAEAIELLRERAEPRLIVLDPDGVTLRGLLCVNSDATGFCIR